MRILRKQGEEVGGSGLCLRLAYYFGGGVGGAETQNKHRKQRKRDEKGIEKERRGKRGKKESKAEEKQTKRRKQLLPSPIFLSWGGGRALAYALLTIWREGGGGVQILKILLT